MNRLAAWIVVFFVLMTLSAVSAAAVECGPTPTDGCAVTQSTTFVLGIYNLPNGIQVVADDVVLDCNGAVINGSNLYNAAGISAGGQVNVTVQGCIIQNYWFPGWDTWTGGTGITFGGMNDSRIFNNTILRARFGIKINGSSIGRNLTIEFNRIENMVGGEVGGFGIRGEMNDSKLLNNTILFNVPDILLQVAGSNNLIEGNVIARPELSDDWRFRGGLFVGGSAGPSVNNTLRENEVRNAQVNLELQFPEYTLNRAYDTLLVDNVLDNATIRNDGANTMLCSEGRFNRLVGRSGIITTMGIDLDPSCAWNVPLGIEIAADHFDFDCNGALVNGTGLEDARGISSQWRNNVTVRNCTVENYGTGISFEAMQNSTIRSNTVRGVRAGVRVNGSQFGWNNTVAFNRVENAGLGYESYGPGEGIDLSQTDSRVLNNTVLHTRNGWGIRVWGSNTRVEGNLVRGIPDAPPEEAGAALWVWSRSPDTFNLTVRENEFHDADVDVFSYGPEGPEGRGYDTVVLDNLFNNSRVSNGGVDTVFCSEGRKNLYLGATGIGTRTALDVGACDWNLPRGFNIDADNIDFDCRGALLNGSRLQHSSGVSGRDVRNITIRNCRIENYFFDPGDSVEAAISLGYVEDVTIINNTLVNVSDGIFLNGSFQSVPNRNILIAFNNIDGAGGIHLLANDSTILNNTIFGRGEGWNIGLMGHRNRIAGNYLFARFQFDPFVFRGQILIGRESLATDTLVEENIFDGTVTSVYETFAPPEGGALNTTFRNNLFNNSYIDNVGENTTFCKAGVFNRFIGASGIGTRTWFDIDPSCVWNVPGGIAMWETSDLDFDCRGAFINGSNLEWGGGFQVQGSRNITVENCRIRNYGAPPDTCCSFGAAAFDSENITFRSLDIADSQFGFFGGNHNGVVEEGNSITDVSAGIVHWESAGTHVIGNAITTTNASGPGELGILFDNSQGISLEQNIVSGYANGVILAGFGFSLLGNKVTAEDFSLSLFDSSVGDNTLAGPASSIAISGNNTVYSGNIFNDSIVLSQAFNNTFTNNTFGNTEFMLHGQTSENVIMGNIFNGTEVIDNGPDNLWCVDTLGNNYLEGATYTGPDIWGGTCKGTGPYTMDDMPQSGYLILSGSSPQLNEDGALIQDIENVIPVNRICPDDFPECGTSPWYLGYMLIARADGMLGQLDLRTGDIAWNWNLNPDGAWFNATTAHLQSIGYDRWNDMLYLGLDGARKEIWRLPGDSAFWTAEVLLEEPEPQCGEEEGYINRIAYVGETGQMPGSFEGSCSMAFWGLDVSVSHAEEQYGCTTDDDCLYGRTCQDGDCRGAFDEEERKNNAILGWVCIGNDGGTPHYNYFKANATCAATVMPGDYDCMNFFHCVGQVDGWPSDTGLTLPVDYAPEDARFSTAMGWGGFKSSEMHSEWYLRAISPDVPEGDYRAQTEGRIVWLGENGTVMPTDLQDYSSWNMPDQPALFEGGFASFYAPPMWPLGQLWVSIDNGFINPWGDSAPEGVVPACRNPENGNIAACDYVSSSESSLSGTGAFYAGGEDHHARLLFWALNPGVMVEGLEEWEIPSPRLGENWGDNWLPLFDFRPSYVAKVGWLRCNDPLEDGCNGEWIQNDCQLSGAQQCVSDDDCLEGYTCDEGGWCQQPPYCTGVEAYFEQDYGPGTYLRFNATGRIKPWLFIADDMNNPEETAVPEDCVVQILGPDMPGFTYWDAATPWVENHKQQSHPTSHRNSYAEAMDNIDVTGPMCIAFVCNDGLQNPDHYLHSSYFDWGEANWMADGNLDMTWFWPNPFDLPYNVDNWEPFYFDINGGCPRGIMPQLPDASITWPDISFSDWNPQPGEQVTIYATVHNIGETALADLNVNITIDGMSIGTRTIPSLPAGGSQQVSADWIAAGNGYHPVAIMADPEDMIDESNESNNLASRSLLVGILQDFGGILLYGSLSSQTVGPFENVGVSGNAVYNTTFGAGEPVSGADVTVRIVEEPSLSATTHTTSWGMYSAVLRAPSADGHYNVSVTVFDGTFSQTLQLPLEVISPPDVVMPDLVIATISVAPETPVEGDLVNVTAYVWNRGNNESGPFNVTLEDDTGSFYAKVFVPGLAAGAIQPASAVWNATPNGWHTLLTATADSTFDVEESSETNNVATRTVRLYPSKPDLTPKRLTLSDPSPAVGQFITVFHDVTNIGGSVAYNPTNDVRDYTEIRLVGDANPSEIAPLGATDQNQDTYRFLQVGTHEVVLDSDIYGVVDEANEENNNMTLNVTVHAPGIDLVIDGVWSSVSSPLNGTTIILYGRARNIGEVNSTGFNVSFSDGATQIGAVYVPALAAGSSAVVSVSWTAAPPGQHNIVVRADPERSVAELNDDNNLRVLGIFVASPTAPALRILSGDIAFSDENPDPNDVVTINATVRNIDQETAYNVPVLFLEVNATTEDVETMTVGEIVSRAVWKDHAEIAELPQGGSATVSSQWTASDIGSHVMVIVVDPFYSIPESGQQGKADNIASRAIEVGKYADLAVFPQDIFFASRPRVGQPTTLYVNVTNKGTITGNATVNISKDGGVISTQQIVNLEGKATAVLNVSFIGTQRFHQIDVEIYDIQPADRYPSNNLAQMSIEVNFPPVLIAALPDLSFSEDTQAGLDMADHFSDPNADVLQYSYQANDSKVPVSFLGNGTAVFTAALNFFGAREVTILASDGDFTVNDSLMVNVTPVNDAPYFVHAVTDQMARVNGTFTLDIDCADVEGDTITYYNNVSQFDIDPASGIIQWIPSSEDAGLLAVEVRCGDAELNTSAEFHINITENRAPYLAIPDQFLQEDTLAQLNLALYSSDPDGDALTYIVIAETASLVDCSILGSTLTMTPAANFYGNSSCEVRADDGFGGTNSSSFDITVFSVNDAPVIDVSDHYTNEDTIPPNQWIDLSAYTTDVDNTTGQLTWSVVSQSNAALIDCFLTDLHYINCSAPAANQTGRSTIEVSVTDGIATAFDLFDVIVQPMNDPPRVDFSAIDPTTIAEDTSTPISLSDHVFDIDNTDAEMDWDCTSNESNVIATVDNVEKALDISAVNDWYGSALVTCTATDPGLLSGTDSFTVEVTPVNDAPVLSPIGDQVALQNLTYTLVLSATDVDSPDLNFSSNTTLFTVEKLNASHARVEFMPTWEQRGDYAIRFTVTDGELTDYEDISFLVRGFRIDLKIEGSDTQVLKTGDANSTVRYNLSIENLGNTADAVSLGTMNQKGWTARFLDESETFITSVTVDSLATRNIFFEVDIPAAASPAESNEVLVTATSENGVVKDSVLTVTAVSGVPSVEITALETDKVAYRLTDAAEVTLTVSNTGGTVVNDLTVSTQITDASGGVVFSATEPIAELVTSRTFTYPGITFSSGGTHTLESVVTSAGGFEYDRETRTFNVGLPVIESFTSQFPVYKPFSTERLTVKARNFDDINHTAYAEFTVTDPDGGVTYFTSAPVTIPPNNADNLRFDYTDPGITGMYTAGVVLKESGTDLVLDTAQTTFIVSEAEVSELVTDKAVYEALEQVAITGTVKGKDVEVVLNYTIRDSTGAIVEQSPDLAVTATPAGTEVPYSFVLSGQPNLGQWTVEARLSQAGVELQSRTATFSVTSYDASAIIGPAGGTLVNPAGTMKVIIPAGALAADTLIEITHSTAKDGYTVVSGPQSAYGYSYDLFPKAAVFAQPVTLVMTYDDAGIVGNENNVDIGLWKKNKWVKQGATLDTVLNTLTLDVTEFLASAP